MADRMWPLPLSRSKRVCSFLVGLLSFGAFLPSTISAWTPAAQRTIIRDTVRSLPPSQKIYWERRLEALEAGVVEPLRATPAAEHAVTEQGLGLLPDAFLREVSLALSLWQQAPSLESAARQLGRALHYLNDANFPLNASSSDPLETRYFADFARYADSARPRFVLVERSLSVSRAQVDELVTLLRRALRRSRQFYPAVAREYRRIDFGSGRLLFDDRSTAFAVAALSYHHAVADNREVLLAFRGLEATSAPDPIAALSSGSYVRP